MHTEKSQPEGKQIMLETRYAEILALSIDPGVWMLGLYQRSMIDYFYKCAEKKDCNSTNIFYGEKEPTYFTGKKNHNPTSSFNRMLSLCIKDPFLIIFRST